MKNMKPSQEMIWEKYRNVDYSNFEFPKTTVFQLLKQENKNRKDNVALGYYGTEITYGELFDNVEMTVDSLKGKIKEGEVVTIASLTTPELVYLFYALGELNALSNFVDPRTSLDGVIKYIEEAHSTKFITLNLFNAKFHSLIEDTTVKEIINISLRDSAKKMPLPLNVVSLVTDVLSKIKYSGRGHLLFKEFINEQPISEVIQSPYYAINKPLTIVHTGGTTGIPKGVLLSHDTFNAMAWQYKYSGLDLKESHRFMNMMPPFIAYGLDMLHMPLVLGQRVDIVSTFNAKKFDELIIKYKPNHFAGVPSHLGSLVHSKKVEKEDLSFIITPAVGGDGITSKLHEEGNNFLLEHGAQNGITPGYALTEANSVFSVCVSDKFKYGSAGFPLPGSTVGIFDENGRELGYNQEGEVCLNTPTMMLGYYNNEEATQTVLKKHEDGKIWIHTGDLGKIDEDGFLWISGRLKNMIIRSDGFKIFPKIIEDVILSHSAVEKCCVVGVRDLEYAQGELPKVYLILKKGQEYNQSQIISELDLLCSSKLPEYALPCGYVVKNEFPLTPIGKVNVMALKEEGNQDTKNNKTLIKK